MGLPDHLRTLGAGEIRALLQFIVHCLICEGCIYKLRKLLRNRPREVELSYLDMVPKTPNGLALESDASSSHFSSEGQKSFIGIKSVTMPSNLILPSSFGKSRFGEFRLNLCFCDSCFRCLSLPMRGASGTR
ncbi:hypothetical protein SAMN05192589_11928 [Paracidovorax valerianellae]|uniref:Uncharacterized protein n=1 Tax=Paracidovorax valerianellae TaxID=187868 RepID=A0A1G7DHW1_9BURK|nr:hypothetical protein SAMN05192589_11928 [Paracidovorax valerianellae]